MDAFVDTSILIDLLRNHPPAVQWQQANAALIIAITPITWMEVVIGARDRNTQRRALQFLSQLTMVYPVQADLDWAMRQLQIHFLSHNVGMNDCLIAAPSVRFQLPLYTHNLKHFAPLLGSLAQKPY